MRRFVTIVALATLAAAPACGGGKSESEKALDAASKQLDQAAKSADQGNAAKSLEDMGKALGALAGGGNANQKPVDPVSFKDLQAAFPDLPGWEKGKMKGEKMTSPVPYSQAEVSYTNGDARITAKLVDSGFNQLLIAPMTMMMKAGFEKETDEGYERSAKIAGLPGWEKYNTNSKSGEVNAIVGNRFILTVEGENVPDTKVLQQVAEKANLSKLPK